MKYVFTRKPIKEEIGTVVLYGENKNNCDTKNQGICDSKINGVCAI